MLPVAYGVEFTRLHILLYTILLVHRDAAAVPHRHERPASTSRPPWCSAPSSCATPSRCAGPTRRAAADEGVPLLDQLPDAAVRGAAGRPLRAASGPERPMAGRSHFAAPLLLAVVAGADRLRLAVAVPLRRGRPALRRGTAPADLGPRRARRHVQQRAAVRAFRLLRRAAGRAALGPAAGLVAGDAAAARCCRSGWNSCRPRSTPRVLEPDATCR